MRTIYEFPMPPEAEAAIEAAERLGFVVSAQRSYGFVRLGVEQPDVRYAPRDCSTEKCPGRLQPTATVCPICDADVPLQRCK